ncbi:sulfatase family protein [Cerasicoccus fimbriatus]|uniref:sulfatase family protein n=1 Tax=Cerasicoccus fimbriatus TaxID=3014554 RepID=UPI0022B3C699|nr:arylsulfatase [Cerasicoccus sp. TK19100]
MPRKPHIVYILTDDLGYGDLPCNNPDSKIPTPNIDRLCGEGLRFSDMHATSAVCTPSRYSILTGRYCWRTHLKSSVLWPWDGPLIEPDRPTVASYLRDQGYRTSCIGKWHLGLDWTKKDGTSTANDFTPGVMSIPERCAHNERIDFKAPYRGGPIDCGFDYHFGIDVPNFPPFTWFEQDRLLIQPTEQRPGHVAGYTGLQAPGWDLKAVVPKLVDKAKEEIENVADQPLFLYFALTSPHTPIVPNDEFIGKSSAGLYGDFVVEVDWVVGEIMEALQRKGIADDTLLVFTSDNGPECLKGADGGAYERIRNHRHYSMGELRGVKRDNWEGGHRVPFIARWPGVTPSGETCTQYASLGDFMATCAAITGTPLPPGAAEDSVSNLPLLEGKDVAVRDHLVHHSQDGQFAIRQDNWVYIDAPTGQDTDSPEPDWFKAERGYTHHDFPGELYDLSADISESRNLYGERPDLVAAMSAKLRAIHGLSDKERLARLPSGSE